MLILLRHPFDVGVKFIAQPVEKIAQLLLGSVDFSLSAGQFHWSF